MSLSNRQSRVLQAVLTTVRPAVLDSGLRTNTCFLTCRLAYEVLARLSVKSVPTPARCMIYNPIATEMIGRGAPENEIRKAVTKRDKPGGPWIVDLTWDDQPNPKNAPAHMVLRVQDILLDLSLDQASRPHKGIVLEPSAFELPSVALFLHGEPVFFPYKDPGVSIVYEYEARYDGWQNVPDWNPHRHAAGWEEFVDHVTTLTKAAIKEAA